MDKAVDRVTTSSHQCASLRTVPTTVVKQSTNPPPETVGISFAADVIKRAKQFILVLRECVTSYTVSSLLPEEEWTSSHSALPLCFFQDGGVFLRTSCFYGVFVCHFYRVRILTRGKSKFRPLLMLRKLLHGTFLWLAPATPGHISWLVPPGVGASISFSTNWTIFPVAPSVVKLYHPSYEPKLSKRGLLCFSKTRELWNLKAAFTIAFFAAVNHSFYHKQRTLKHWNTQNGSKSTKNKSQTMTF